MQEAQKGVEFELQIHLQIHGHSPDACMGDSIQKNARLESTDSFGRFAPLSAILLTCSSVCSSSAFRAVFLLWKFLESRLRVFGAGCYLFANSL